MLDSARPGNVRYVHEAVNAIFDLDEGAKVSQVAHPAMNARADLVTLMQSLPGIVLNLFHSQTNAARLGIDAQTSTSTSSPGFTSLLGCLTRFDQLISET